MCHNTTLISSLTIITPSPFTVFHWMLISTLETKPTFPKILFSFVSFSYHKTLIRPVLFWAKKHLGFGLVWVVVEKDLLFFMDLDLIQPHILLSCNFLSTISLILLITHQNPSFPTVHHSLLCLV